MKVLKILGKTIGILLILLILAFSTLYLLRNRIVSSAVSAVEEYYSIELKYDKVNLSIFRDFPRLSFGIEQLHINQDSGEKKLAKLDELSVSIDFYSLWSKTEALRIHSFILNAPIALYEIHADSTTNWDFLFAEQEEVTSVQDPLRLSIGNYSINDASLFYIDNTSGQSAEILGLSHNGKGELSSVEFDLETHSSIDTIRYYKDGLTINMDYPIIAKAIIHVNTQTQQYEFHNADLQIADISTSINGLITGLDTGYDMDVTISESSSDIKQLLSLIPSSLMEDYKDLSSSGDLSVQGRIQGQYLPNESIYPEIDLKVEIRDGVIKYPELPERISGLNFVAHISKQEGDLDLLQVNLNPLNFKIGNNAPFSMRLLAKELFAGPSLSGELQGKLDLNSLSSTIPMEMIESMSGIVDIDLLFDIFYPDVASENYEKIRLDGLLKLENTEILTDDFPKLNISKAIATISPEVFNISQMNMQLGRSDFEGTATLQNPLIAVLKEGIIKASIKGNSSFVDMNEIMSSSEDTQESNTEESIVPGLFNRLDFELDYRANQFLYDQYELVNLRAPIKIKDGNIYLKNLAFTYDKSPFTMDGELHNSMAYMYAESGDMQGNINLRGESFDLWKFMSSTEESSTENSEEFFQLPERMALDVITSIGRVSYDNYDLKNLDAGLRLENQELQINKGQANIFNGRIGLTGSFAADGTSMPAYDLNYSMNDIAFAEAYKNIITFKKLAPIAEYLRGNFGTDLKIKGFLTSDQMPDLNSLDLSGVVETFNAKLLNFKILNAITDKLQIKSFKEINIGNTQNFIDIENGEFSVKPFPIKLDQIDATISGNQLISGDNINYTIASKIPRAWLENNTVTSKVNQGLNWVKEQAAQYKLNLDAGDYLYVDILVSGSITQPRIALQLKDVGGKSLKESVKKDIDKEAKRIQDSIKVSLEKERKEMERIARNRADSLKKAAEEEARRKAKELLTGKKSDDKGGLEDELKKAGEDAKGKIDELKDKFNKWKKN